MKGVIEATEAVKQEAIRLILQTAKTGHIYKHHGVEHQASAPGEPPASETGHLVNSIKTEYDEGKLMGAVVVQAPYGIMLEFGTEKMAGRPYLRPALANKAPGITGTIAVNVGKAFRGVV